MTGLSNRELQSRLKSCLKAVLDLEPELMNHDMGKLMVNEFEVLRGLLDRLPAIAVVEQDVQKVEEATSVFLDELQIPLKDLHSVRGGLLQ